MKKFFQFLASMSIWIVGCIVSAFYNQGDPHAYIMLWGAIVFGFGTWVKDKM
jgi:hypothetical protein